VSRCKRCMGETAQPATAPASHRTSGTSTLQMFHGTSWTVAQRIRREGFVESKGGCLGPGVYVAREEKATRFAANLSRHGGETGGLVKVNVTFRNAKYVSGDDNSWQRQGYDACRTDKTSVSSNIEWCMKSRSQVQVVSIQQITGDRVQLGACHEASVLTAIKLQSRQQSSWILDDEDGQEALAAMQLLNTGDPTLLTQSEIFSSFGSCLNFFLANGLRPSDPDDWDEALAISGAMKTNMKSVRIAPAARSSMRQGSDSAVPSVPPKSAARTNLSSRQVTISRCELGQGTFRVAFEGTYVGGTRNQQEAACKRFKPQFAGLEDEFFADDFRVAEKSIEFAEHWNAISDPTKTILVSKGDVMQDRGVKYLVEPFIRHYAKFSSNSGWIASTSCALAMEAFSHYTYHLSGGSLLVCDLQGRYRYNKFNKRESRYELTDPAICSIDRLYGPTDLGEKGIDTFFFNHKCNQFCNLNGELWLRPYAPAQWFEPSSGTSMFSSSVTDKLNLKSRATFKLGLDCITEDNGLYDECCDGW